MASIREHRTSSGEFTFKVLFRDGRKQRSRSFVTREAAERFVTRIDLDGIEAALTELAPPKGEALTVDQLAERWLEKRAADVANGSLTPRTLTGYRRDYDNWISRYLGKRPAADLTELDVQRWVEKIATMPKSSGKSVADRHAILHGIYKWASDPRRALVPRNPCIGTELPKRTKPAPKGLRMPEILALTAAARQVDPAAADLIDFILGTGWRIGEAIALTAGQVEDDGTAIYVTMSRVWRREVGYVEGGKSAAAMRRLRVLGDAVPVLRRRIVGLGPGDIVFTSERGRPWDAGIFRRDHWSKITVAADLGGGWRCKSCDVQPTEQARVTLHERTTGHKVERIEGRNPTPHWLRHSHVLICHNAGMSLAEIQRRIGHEDIQMTINTYGRLIEDMSDEVAARLDALLTTRPAAQEVISGTVVGELT